MQSVIKPKTNAIAIPITQSPITSTNAEDVRQSIAIIPIQINQISFFLQRLQSMKLARLAKSARRAWTKPNARITFAYVYSRNCGLYAMVKWNVWVSIVFNCSRFQCVFFLIGFFFKTAVTTEDEGVPRYRDPAMIGILVAMFLMFITICVVLRLFSKYVMEESLKKWL